MVNTRQLIYCIFCLSALLPFSDVFAAEDSIVLESANHRIKVTTVVDGLDSPWAMAMLSHTGADGSL